MVTSKGLERKLKRLEHLAKQIIANPAEKYERIPFGNKKIDLLEETSHLFILDCQNMESPLSFSLKLMQGEKPDFRIYMSLKHKEPSEKNH